MSKIMRTKGSKVALSLFLMTLFLFSSLQAYGAVAPGVTRLQSIDGLSFPGRVTADQSGNVYVADFYNKYISIYNHSGVSKGTIRLVNKPTALAVSPDNHLYVAEKVSYNGQIQIFTLDGGLVRSINISGGIPTSLAFLSTGEMYLMQGYFVKKFDASMTMVSQFGGFSGVGNAPGRFIDATSLAINEQKGEIYVLDKGALGTEGSYANSFVWRVQVFDLSGTYLRSFSNYGYGQIGMAGAAASITLDKLGRVYIADNVQGIVVVYDEFGAYLTTIYDNNHPLLTPVDVFYINDRLYIDTLYYAPDNRQNFVTIYGIDDFASLSVSPSALDIAYQQGSQGKTVTISNSGSGQLSWQAAADVAWLSLSSGGGTVNGSSSQDITVTVDPAGLSAGNTYSGNINVTSNGGSEKVSVTVTIVAPPVLTVTPAAFTVQKTANETIAPLNVNIEISNDQSGSVMWQATSDVDWMRLSPQSGINNTIPAPSISISDTVLPGTYVGHITVAADGADGSPATITVNLEVISSGKVVVTTNNSAATFTITGPSGSYSGSGMNYTLDNAQEGSYSITFGAVSGFKTPAPATLTLATGGSVLFTGEYVDLSKMVNIIASHGAMHRGPSDIGIFRTDGTKAAGFAPFTELFGSITAVGDINDDGSMDIIVGSVGGKMPALVKGFSRTGVLMQGASFRLSEKNYNPATEVLVATGDFNNDGRDEIVTATDLNRSSVVRVFAYNGQMIVDTGIYFGAASSNSGVNIAVADVDGDGTPELITLARKNNSPQVNILKINTSAGIGKWTLQPVSSFKACFNTHDAHLAAGDVDGDGISDIIAACMHNSYGTEIQEYNAAGLLIRKFNIDRARVESIAAGDTNMDGIAEIVVGGGTGNTVKIFDASGGIISSFNAFSDGAGVRVSVGNLGY